MWLLILFGLYVLGVFVVIFIFRIVEPAYVLIFNKPLYLYFYPFPKKLNPEQKFILDKEFPFYRNLSHKKKIYFEHRVKSFLNKYPLVGNDIAVTPEMMIIVAGTYVVLTFGMRRFLIDRFDKIILYPTAYFSTINDGYHKGEFNPRMKAVVFSWEDFLLGHKTSNDNVNLGFHEFAHVLHFHALKSNDPSAIIFYDEFKAISKYYKDEKMFAELISKEYFRAYAYENQFEFLAVVLEHFFESPEIFQKEFPELYERVRRMINFTFVK